MNIVTHALVLVGLMASPVAVGAQSTFATYGVQDWRSLIPLKRIEFQTYRTIVLTNPSIDDDEKARRVTAKYAAVEKDIRDGRVAEYRRVERKVEVGNSATKGNPGGDPKKSSAQCRGADLPDMYTEPAWARGAVISGAARGAEVLASGSPVPINEVVIENGAQICAVFLKQSGKGQKASQSEGLFRIRPAAIDEIVDREISLIMAEVAKIIA